MHAKINAFFKLLIIETSGTLEKRNAVLGNIAKRIKFSCQESGGLKLRNYMSYATIHLTGEIDWLEIVQ